MPAYLHVRMARTMRTVLFVIALFLPLASAANASMRPLPATQKKTLVTYLKKHGQSPEDYVISKFSDHDIVLIGEWHRIRHDPLLIQALIPRLYKAGVYNLGSEFANEEDQAAIDDLITSDVYDDTVARRVQFNEFVMWGFQEYEDLYRAAWMLNHSLPKGARRFRIVALSYQVRWDLLTENPTTEQRKLVWHKGDPDVHMGQVILREFVDKGEKALIYSGIHHAFTRYKQPDYDFEKQRLNTLVERRMGQVVYQKIGARAFTIFLHAPWASNKGDNAPPIYPVGGAIDQVMEQLPGRRIGFDLVGTPFGELQDPDSYYALGHENFRLSDFADGYIFQVPIKAYSGCTVDMHFITPENLEQAIAAIPNVRARNPKLKPEDLLKDMQRDADMRWRFRNIE